MKYLLAIAVWVFVSAANAAVILGSLEIDYSGGQSFDTFFDATIYEDGEYTIPYTEAGVMPEGVTAIHTELGSSISKMNRFYIDLSVSGNEATVSYARAGFRDADTSDLWNYASDGYYYRDGRDSENDFDTTVTGVSFNYSSVSEVPIPAAAWLFGSALLGLGVIKRRSL